ncbi:MAG TPA: Rieske 2Fe-2S domain-containing protein [Methylomirabilota bacterium]|nr:Rieske 2Fe-2S domain-containing protein [Methylomirabilota bacterium]
MTDLPALTRRRFIKIFSVGSVASTFGGRLWAAGVVGEVQPAAAGHPGMLTLRVSDYPALAEEGGSVRLSVNPININDNMPAGFFYPILINRGEGGEFFVLDAECTHARCVVEAYDRDFGVMACPCHQSLYYIDGTLAAPAENGSPDQPPLRRLDFTYDGADRLVIRVPGLGYTVQGSALETAAGPRLRLRFDTFPNARYQVHFRPTAAVPWQQVPFALTETGPVDQLELVGNGRPRSVQVPRTLTKGFYAVAIRLLDLT